MAAKMGLLTHDSELNRALMQLMYDDSADYTNTFRSLSSVPAAWLPSDALPPKLAAVLGTLSQVGWWGCM